MIGLNTSLVKGFDIDSFYVTPPIDYLVLVSNKNKYFGEVTKNGNTFCKLLIDCADESPNFQIDINLFELKENSTNTYTIRPTGYVVLHSSEGEDKYVVKIADPNKEKLFDNQSLIGNELLAITLITPGEYIAVDKRNNLLTCKIIVNEPTSESVETISNPITVNISENAIVPNTIQIISGQPIIFDSFEETRLTIKPKDDQVRFAMNSSWKSTEDNLASLNKDRNLSDIA